VKKALLGALPLLFLMVVFLALPNLLAYALAAGWVKDAFYQAQLGRWHDAIPAGYHALVAASLAASLAILARKHQVWQKVLAIACLNTLLLSLAVAPLLGDILQGPVKRAALYARSRPEPGILWNFHMPSFSVYRQQVSPTVQASSGQIALTRFDRLPPDRPVDILFREGGVVLVKVH